MPDVTRMRFTLIQLAAAPATIDAVDPGPDWTVLEVAGDESLWLGAEDARIDAAVERSAFELEPGAGLCDVTDGWSGVLLQGDGRHETFAALSELRLASPGSGVAFVQGGVLGLPAKVVVLPGAIAVLFPATASGYVEASLRDAGAPVDAAAPVDWSTADRAPDERLVR